MKPVDKEERVRRICAYLFSTPDRTATDLCHDLGIPYASMHTLLAYMRDQSIIKMRMLKAGAPRAKPRYSMALTSEGELDAKLARLCINGPADTTEAGGLLFETLYPGAAGLVSTMVVTAHHIRMMDRPEPSDDD